MKLLLSSSLFLFGLASASAASSFSAQSAADVDTTNMAVNLKEVCVAVDPVIRKSDRNVYLPKSSERNSSKNGVQLLYNMQLPSLAVDPVNNSISLSGRGNLAIRINGRPASSADVAALLPSDIIKVEYIQDPSLRFQDASAVIDFIVKKTENGGSVMLNLIQGINRGWANHTASIKSNFGNSEIGAFYKGTLMWDNLNWRDNDESFVLPDGSAFSRAEDGIPVRNNQFEHFAKIFYNYSIAKKLLFSLEARFACNDASNNIQGFIASDNSSVLAVDKNPSSSYIPSIDAYLQYSLPHKQAIFANASFSFNRTNSSRFYAEDDMTPFCSDVRSSGKSLRFEADYEKSLPYGKFTAGLCDESFWSENDYSASPVRYCMNDHSFSAFAEWRQTFSRIFYSVAAEGRYYVNSNNISHSRFSFASFNPKASFRYSIKRGMSIRAIFSAKTQIPSPSELYPISQQIDAFQSVCGNADIKPYLLYNPHVEYEYANNWLSGKLVIDYQYAHKPIMSFKEFSPDDVLVKSFKNQGSWQEFDSHADFRIQIVRNWLSLSGTAGWHRFFSYGDNYKHSYAQPYASAQISLAHNKWFCFANFSTNRNRLWGENINGSWNLQIVGGGYNFAHCGIYVGITNPLVNNFRIASRDLNELAGFSRSYHTDCTQNLLWVTFTLNTSWGKRFKAQSRKFVDSDSRQSVKAVGK